MSELESLAALDVTSTNAGSVVRMYSTSWRTEWFTEDGSLADVSYHASNPFSATYDEYLFLPQTNLTIYKEELRFKINDSLCLGILTIGTSRLLAKSTTGMGLLAATSHCPSVFSSNSFSVTSLSQPRADSKVSGRARSKTIKAP